MSNNNKPKPALDLIKELQLNKIKVMWKNDGPDLLLWCNYGEHKNKKQVKALKYGAEVSCLRNVFKRLFLGTIQKLKLHQKLLMHMWFLD
jgi:hypothetical protein